MCLAPHTHNRMFGGDAEIVYHISIWFASVFTRFLQFFERREKCESCKRRGTAVKIFFSFLTGGSVCQRDTSACFFMLFRMSKWFHAAGRNYDKFQNKNASNARKTKILSKKSEKNKQTNKAKNKTKRSKFIIKQERVWSWCRTHTVPGGVCFIS